MSVIIPTFNRFRYVLNTISSIRLQTVKSIEIIVVNDRSTQAEYYTHDWQSEGVTIVHLKENSKKIYGFACAAHVRNHGAARASGKWLAFCDDDDIWFPKKLALQLAGLEGAGDCQLSCTDGRIGKGPYNSNLSYKMYNAEHYASALLSLTGMPELPSVWDLKFLRLHNCVICSSVLMTRRLWDTIGGMNILPNGKEDYDCWLRALEHTNCIYIRDPCFYYDNDHGDGQNY